jgi:hypothetical protein
MGHYNSFLLRVWTEESSSEVRGSVQHVGTQESIYFTSWDKMVDFILNHLDWHISHAVDCEEMGQIKVELRPGDEKFG